MNLLHNAWMECPFKLILVTLYLIDVIHANNCPPIFIKTIPEADGCWPECLRGKYCQHGQCQTCLPCPDPYTMAEQDRLTELLIRAECINKGSCPTSCDTEHAEYNHFLPKGNATLCDCVDVTPPPPTVPPTIACKVGCKHGGCVRNGECNCTDGWSGALCDKCDPAPGCKNGYCNETERCICNQYWDGVNCDQDVSYCAMHQSCLNNARCENDGSGGYTCTCSEGFSGANCENETSRHQCQRSCPINGTCLEVEESTGIYQCHCPRGFMGADCTQRNPRSSPWSSFYVVLAIGSVGLLIVVIGFMVLICKRCKIQISKPEGIPGSSSNSGVPLIPGEIGYRLEGTTVFLTIKPSWTPCWLKTCKCLMEAPLNITKDSGTEISVSDGLREGFKYHFEIRRCKTTAPNVEDSDCSVAECEVSVVGLPVVDARENGDGNCTDTIGHALGDVATMRALNRTLEADRRLRERVADFFTMSSDHQKSFVDGHQTPMCQYVDILREVLESYDFVDKPIGELLSHLAGEISVKTEDFVERLTKFHPTCQSCPRILHETHGGTTVWSYAASNGVAIDVV